MIFTERPVSTCLCEEESWFPSRGLHLLTVLGQRKMAYQEGISEIHSTDFWLAGHLCSPSFSEDVCKYCISRFPSERVASGAQICFFPSAALS